MKKKIRIWMLAVILTLCGTLNGWADNVSYIECSWDEAGQKVVQTQKSLSSGTYSTSFTSFEGGGWFVVDHDTEIIDVLIATEDTKILICDGCTLTIFGYLFPRGKRISIYSQSYGSNMGKLIIKKDTESGNDKVYTNKRLAAFGSQPNNWSSFIDIHGGDIQASSTFEYSCGMCGYINIFGGKVYAQGGKYGAGIYGDMTVYGGYVEAHGGAYGAGIGGIISMSGCNVVVNGGEVYAYGGSDAAGIGSGEELLLDDNISGGSLTVNGGFVYAQGNDAGAGIGGGENADGGTVTINGGTVVAKAGSESGTGHRAIGPGEGSDNYGSLIIGDNMMVRAGSSVGTTLFTAAERVPACWYRVNAYIEPCTHSDAIYTVSGTTSEDTHTMHCAYCTTEFTAEKHTFSDDKCNVCGVEATAYTVTIYLPKNNGSTDGVYEATTYQMATGTEFNMPGSPTTPEYLEFAGWLVGDPTGLNSYLTEGETLLPEGQAYTISGDVSFTARYRYLNISLSDNADNGEKLMKYNGMTAPKVILAGRTLYKDGSWNTLCLPFDIHNYKDNQPLKGATVMTLESASFNENNGTLTLNFTDAGNGIKAGKPYIVKWIGTENAELQNPEFSYVTISNTTTDIVTDVVAFKGILSPYDITEEDKTMLYMGAGNTLYYPNGAMTIGSCRAYFQLADALECGEPKTAGADGINQFVLNFGDESTGISLTPDPSPESEWSTGAWYDMQGRRLSQKPTVKGIYINKGKKVVIK